MYILETHNLSKKYKDKYAVKDVNMHIKEGDIYGFVGENGAGKTTIIRLITSLASPTSGDYSLYGVNYKDSIIYEQRKNVAAIVEKVSINRSVTALENLKYQCLLCDIKKSDEQLINILESVGLSYENIQKKKAKNFSLGMRQRLGIAMVMVQEPKFVILDEPMNGLDPQGFVEIRETIVNLNKKGVTFLISSHILSELDKICNKIGFISHGKLLDEISMEDLRFKESKKISISTADNESFYKLLKEELSLDKISIEQNNVIIRDKIELDALIKFLSDNKINVLNIETRQETVEDYYMSLIRKEITQ